MSRYITEVTEDSIGIYDTVTRDYALYWNLLEFIEEPTLALSVATAIKLSYEQPDQIAKFVASLNS